MKSLKLLFFFLLFSFFLLEDNNHELEHLFRSASLDQAFDVLQSP